MKHGFFLLTLLLLFSFFFAAPSRPAQGADAYSCSSSVSTPDSDICTLNSGDTSGTSGPCVSFSDPWANAGSGHGGARVNFSTTTNPIDRFGTCRYVKATSAFPSGSSGAFVPFRTEMEWTTFLNNVPSPLYANTCACPFSGINRGQHLYYGPATAYVGTDKTGGGSDVTDNDLYASVSLPYGETGSTYSPGTHSFSFQCYEEYSEDYNFTCDADCHTNEDGTSSCNRHDAPCNSRCHTGWDGHIQSWQEVFSFFGSAGSNTSSSPSWSGSSSKVSGTRPTACLTRCTESGGHCSCSTTGGQTITPTTCTVPAQHDFTMIAKCYINYQTSATCTNWFYIVAGFQAMINQYIAAGDLCAAAAEMDMLNNFIDYTNITAAGW